jgi:hypothetical protein
MLWSQPILPRSWGLLGKILQYLAGLTILLDLFGEEKVQALHDRAKNARKRTADRIKILVPSSVSTTKGWFKKYLLWTLPLAYITTGYFFFWGQVYLLNYSLTLSFWLTVAGMVIAPVAAVLIEQNPEGNREDLNPLGAFVGVLVFAAAIGSYIRGNAFALWHGWLPLHGMIIQFGSYLLVIAAYAASLAAYTVFIGTVSILLSIVQLISLAILIGVARPARWALRKNGHPLRWLAFFIFSIGFFLDLLAS